MSHSLHVHVARDRVLSRRAFVRSTVGGSAALASTGLLGRLGLRADEMQKNGMACILLFLQGGASQFESFDPKPGTEAGGPTKAIGTSIPGIHVAEHFPHVAKQMEDIAIIRSMTGKENDHQRAVHLLHTGYAQSPTVKYPSLGSIAASHLGSPNSDFPGYVKVGTGSTLGPGFLGTSFAPLSVPDPERLPRNIELPGMVSQRDLDRRLNLLDKMEQGFANSGKASLVENHRGLYETAAKLVVSPKLKVFELADEPASIRDEYGRSSFGQGCLLARRLIETGVSFVEVNSGGNVATTNWDAHQDNFERHKRLAAPVDQAFPALIRDLKSRGMLEKTLIICMGEFGRTPTINGKAGRDHYARAFSIAMAGGGVRGGQVIGSTDESGTDIATRPVTVSDLFCSIYHTLKIDPRDENYDGDRPIVLIDGGVPVLELFS